MNTTRVDGVAGYATKEQMTDFGGGPFPRGVVFMPQGPAIGVNRAHSEMLGRDKQALIESGDVLLCRINEATRPSEQFGSYGQYFSAIGVLRDTDCVITQMFQEAVKSHTLRRLGPKVQYRRPLTDTM